MKQVKKIRCQYCLKKTTHRLISMMYVGNAVKKTFLDKLLKRDVAYYWECDDCGRRIRRRKRK